LTPVREGDHADEHSGQDLQPGLLAVDAAWFPDDERDHQHGKHHEGHRPRVVDPELGGQKSRRMPARSTAAAIGHRRSPTRARLVTM
jgi:hypothetical protein